MWTCSTWLILDYPAKLGTALHKKIKFSIKDFFSKCDQLVTFTEEILNGKFHFLCSAAIRGYCLTQVLHDKALTQVYMLNIDTNI